jgi:hypothetical protein
MLVGRTRDNPECGQRRLVKSRRQRQGRAWFSDRPKPFEPAFYPPPILTGELLLDWLRHYDMDI